MASEEKVSAKRGSSDGSLSPGPAEKRHEASGAVQSTFPASDTQAQSSTNPEPRRNMIPTPPRRRSLPCIACIGLMSRSEVACCYDGYSPDACARCAVRKQECVQPIGTEVTLFCFKSLHDRYYEGNYDPEPSKDQRVAQGYIRYRETRKSLVTGLKHGVENILEMVGESGVPKPDELACFRKGADGMASLLIDMPAEEIVAQRKSASLGGEIANEIVNANEHSFHKKSFRKGAEAVVSLLDGGKAYGYYECPEILESFIRGAEIFTEHIKKQGSPVL